MKMIKILLTPIRIFLTVTISVFKFLLSFSSTILLINQHPSQLRNLKCIGKQVTFAKENIINIHSAFS